MTDDLTINDGTSDFNYVCISNTDNEAIYRDDSSSLSNPRTLRVSHDITDKVDGTDRHLVSFARTDDNAESVPYTGTTHVVIAAPREGVTEADLLKEWNKLSSTVTANFSRIVAGFQPA